MIRLRQTCGACPEQYDAYEGDEKVGYLRLRHGSFTVDCPDHTGTCVYQAAPRGDGIFEDEERDYYLRFAVDAIERWVAAHRFGDEFNLKPPAPDVQYEIE